MLLLPLFLLTSRQTLVPERKVSRRKGYFGVGTVTAEALVDGVPLFCFWAHSHFDGMMPFFRRRPLLRPAHDSV
jgi:hypothetical protein